MLSFYVLAPLMAVFGWRRLSFIMKFMQQQGYHNIRLFRFSIKKLQLLDKRVFIPFVIAAVATKWTQFAWTLPALALIVQIIREKSPMVGIKPLNWTARVKRIFGVAFALWLGALAFSQSLCLMTTMVLLAPVFLILSNFILIPFEKMEQQKYINEAKAKLSKFNPTIIGITGSYGKTSLKNILHHILGTYTTSFATKRSINTLMGIVRVIREEMTTPPKFFVAEIGIGAKHQMQPLLKFINPDMGIITAVGAAHLENFRSIDEIAREKFRLSQWVHKKGGSTVLSGANIDPEFIEKYGSKNDVVFTGNEISNIKQTIDGLSFTLNYNGEKYDVFAPIYGMHQAQNIAIAFIMSLKLGVSADSVITALKSLKQTEHRLELKHEGDLIVVDDAFNSNIKGFISAMETCAAVKGNGRFIMITPGMVDLGTMHAEQHKLAGSIANKLCDVVIAVKPDRIKDFTDEIKSDKLVTAPNLAVAREWLSKNAQAGDVILYENDLPDLFIEKISI